MTMYSRDFEDHFGIDAYKRPEPWSRVNQLSNMEIITIIISALGIVVVLVLLCRCCRRSKQGQIISPPPPAPPGPLSSAPYPQQQFVAAYPVSSPYPAYPAPVAMPLPAGGASAAPHGARAPLPVGVYPHPAPHMPTAPDLTALYGPPAPDWNAATLPPSYEQATGANMKQSPYNPSYPHS